MQKLKIGRRSKRNGPSARQAAEAADSGWATRGGRSAVWNSYGRDRLSFCYSTSRSRVPGLAKSAAGSAWNSHLVGLLNGLQQPKGMTMNISFNTVCLAAAVLAGSTALASAQSGSTDSRGNAIGSERIGNGVPIRDGAMHRGMQGTTGMSNNRRSEQDNPNGSPNTPPISREGPGGDPSRNNDAPK
jgi:hypothetical protein